MAAYYNEIDKFAAAWLRELIARNVIAPGDVDERSIVDVRPHDLRGYTQCHFFAGIGVWSYALRRAGWPDDRPVWTGSCPCQPFSPAGKGEGFNDPRHLWPEFFRLIRERRPGVVFGEQTASPSGLVWLDLVSDDVEGIDYAIGAANFPAASVGAPHIRQRLYWVADSQGAGRWPDARPVRGGEATGLRAPEGENERGAVVEAGRLGGGGTARGVADANGRDAGAEGLQRGGEHGQRPQDGGARRVDDADSARPQGHRRPVGEHGQEGWEASQRHEREIGFWDDAEWIACTDGKARPVEPGTFPLVTGAPARLVRLRGYGNAINAEQAKAFIGAYLDVRGGSVAA